MAYQYLPRGEDSFERMVNHSADVTANNALLNRTVCCHIFFLLPAFAAGHVGAGLDRLIHPVLEQNPFPTPYGSTFDVTPLYIGWTMGILTFFIFSLCTWIKYYAAKNERISRGTWT